MRVVAGILLSVALAACAGAATASTTTTTAPRSALPTTCRMTATGLPDPICTPGAADPAVTQANIGQTICVAGYTATIRPPTSYTTPLKVQQMALYGFTGSPADYEEDHVIALELGGDPRDPKNLWPQPVIGAGAASLKDRVENWAHDEVCAGRMQLIDVQRQIAADWRALYQVMVVAQSPAPTPHTAAPTQTASSTAAVLTGHSVSVSVTTPVGRNANATASAQTTPGSACTVVVTYNSGPSGAAGLGPAIASASGAVNWTWRIGGATALGTYPVDVTCTSPAGARASARALFAVD